MPKSGNQKKGRGGTSNVEPRTSNLERGAGGRPTDYREEYAELAKKFFLLNKGATDADLATFLGVCEASVNNWKVAHPEFLESVKAGKEMADVEVAASLYKRAVGFEVTVQKVVNGELQDCKEYVPGDVKAMQLFLSNRTHWRDKQQLEHSGRDGAPIELAEMSAADLRRLAAKRGLLNAERGTENAEQRK